ncbi:GPI inositol-deacylase [Tachypleus tridentatus]|uniref:GPI inositol-deacylase n=1 Tax=Tachypleus tridentatus TaxID=6853 RepID=UPI003FCFEDD3
MKTSIRINVLKNAIIKLHLMLGDVWEDIFNNPIRRIAMPSPVMHKFPRYKLFIYGEGRYAEGLRSGQLGGLPLLFIPGNAGSYRQVRSLGSVALRMAESLRSPFHFNMFSVDLNEELSGIYGGVLNEQIQFVHECIQHIRKMYKKNVEIILVGHSMGGVLARAVFVHEGFNTALVPLIFTQASPHIASLASFDSALQDFFTRVNDLWEKKWNSTLNHVSVVSVSGGERDILVQSDLTQLIPEANSINSISVVSTAVPGVWASTDHLCIVWCKQLVMTTVRALFDVVDLKTHTILQDLAEREKVLKYHFLRKYGEKHFVRQPKLQHQLFPSLGIWILKEELSWHFSKNKVLSYNFILVPLFEGETIIVVGDGLVKEDWVFACSAVTKGNDTMSCHEGENFSNKGALILSRERKTDRKCFQYPAKDLLMKGHSHLLVQISPSNKMVHVIGERYKEISRNKTVRLPSIMRNFLNFGPTQLLTIPLSEGAVFYKLFLSGLQELWQAYSIIIETRICRGGAHGLCNPSGHNQYYECQISVKMLSGSVGNMNYEVNAATSASQFQQSLYHRLELQRPILPTVLTGIMFCNEWCLTRYIPPLTHPTLHPHTPLVLMFAPKL